ncbi:MAG: class II aldolase/adducin family protein [Candidatus Woesearchaeota archaeon]
MDDDEIMKKEICMFGKRLSEEGLSMLAWGNLSMIDRGKDLIAIKPSGANLSEISPDDIPLVRLSSGDIIEGSKRPSVDKPIHIEIYRSFKDVGAIIHMHSPYCTIFAQAGKPIECLGTTHADHFKGDIPVIDIDDSKIRDNHAFESNTGKAIIKTFTDQGINPMELKACLVKHHGPFVWGEDIASAFENAVVLERIAFMNYHTLMLEKQNKMSEEIKRKHFERKNGIGAYYGQEERG